MNNPDLSAKQIFIFWIPLAATWIMMSVEGPFLAAIIARMAEPKFNLAAYGVAYSFALIIEAPVIMMMSASTALVKNYQSFRKLRDFTYILNTMVTVVMLIFIIPGIFYFITVDLINLPVEIAKITHIAAIVLIPWPGAIGYRRFYQGILIRNNLTKRVAYGTVIRLSSMTATALILYFYSDIDGGIVGAAALSAGVLFEAAASKFMALGILKKLENEKDINDNQPELSFKEIYGFYYPLALTSLITLGVQPLVIFFIGQSKMAVESLAILPVVASFVFIFRSLGLSFQEVAITFIGESKSNYIKLRNFATALGVSTSLILGIVAFSPLADFWLSVVSGLSDELTEFSKLPLILMIIMPALTVLISFQRAVLVEDRNTKPITIATIIEFIGIFIVLLTLVHFYFFIGAIAAVIAFAAGRISANLYLIPPFNKSIK